MTCTRFKGQKTNVKCFWKAIIKYTNLSKTMIHKSTKCTIWHLKVNLTLNQFQMISIKNVFFQNKRRNFLLSPLDRCARLGKGFICKKKTNIHLTYISVFSLGAPVLSTAKRSPQFNKLTIFDVPVNFTKYLLVLLCYATP